MTDRFMARATVKTEGKVISGDDIEVTIKFLKEDIQKYSRISAHMKRRIVETIMVAEQEISELRSHLESAYFDVGSINCDR